MSDEIEVTEEECPPTPRSTGIAPPPASSTATSSRETLGAAIVARAAKDIVDGVCEEPLGSNDGPVVGAYLKRVGVAAPAQWCAAAFSAWMIDACAELDVMTLPVKPAAAALGLAHEFMEKGAFVGPHDVALVEPGMAVFWRRPPSAWHGHVGVVEEIVDAEHFVSIEGNSGPNGDRVARMKRRFDDPLLFGFGKL